MLCLHTQIWSLIVCFIDADIDHYSTDSLFGLIQLYDAHVRASVHSRFSHKLRNSNRGTYCFPPPVPLSVNEHPVNAVRSLCVFIYMCVLHPELHPSPAFHLKSYARKDGSHQMN